MNSQLLASTSDSKSSADTYSLDSEYYSTNFGVLRVSGELDMTTRIEIVQALHRLASSTSTVVVDISKVTFMYSGVANAIIDVARSRPSSVSVFAPSRSVRMIFDALGASDVLIDHAPVTPGI